MPTADAKAMTADVELMYLPSDPDKQRCLKCGADALDTGWECTECGYDNMQWYNPEGYKRLQESGDD